MQRPADPDSSAPLQAAADAALPVRRSAADAPLVVRADDDARLRAAASLLGDESPRVRRAVARELGAAGLAGLRLLRRAARSSDAQTRSVARRLLDDRAWERARRRLARYVAAGAVRLEPGMWRLAALEHPAFDARPYRRALDAMAREVQNRAAIYSDPLDRARVLVDYLGRELGYTGDIESYTSPDNVFLHRTIERKRGLPLTLCALYAAVARRAGLRTGLLPLPGHVMLRLYGRERNLIVDPFHGGEARTQEALREYLAEHGLQFRPVWFQRAPDDVLLRRQVANLRNSLVGIGRVDRARRLSAVLALFAPRAGEDGARDDE